MKTIYIFTIALLTLCSSAYAQSKKEYNYGIGIFYGTGYTGGFEFNIHVLQDKGHKFNNGFSLGLGLGLRIEDNLYGDNYTTTLEPFAFPEDLDDFGTVKDPAVYLNIAYHVGRLGLGGRIGTYSISDYQQGYNSIMGSYHVFYNSRNKILYGGFIEGRITPKISLVTGYDTYNEISIAANFRF